MAYDYDRLYAENPNALGAPTSQIVEFFEGYSDKSANVLDVGCGQGRDAIPLARMGYHVTGVDLSPAGIDDLSKAAVGENLPITASVADLVDYTPETNFDILLIDRTLHMLDREPRLAALERLLDCAKRAVIIADEPRNLPDMKTILKAHNWPIALHKAGHLFAMKERS